MILICPLATLPQLERGASTKLLWWRKLNMMTSSLANIVTVKSATRPTPLILSRNKRKSVRRISSKSVLLSTKKVPVKKP